MNDTRVRTHRIYSSESLEPGQEMSLQGQAAHYLSRVLRVAPGQTIVLFNGDGHDYPSEVLSCAAKSLRLRVSSRVAACRESPLHITLVQALSRGERFDATLQKCTELGAAAFIPLKTERTEVRIKPEKLQRRMQHWHSVVVSACEQSGRALVPTVAMPVSLQDWLSQPVDGLRVVLDPSSDCSLATIHSASRIAVLVGPEGGFSESELSHMDQKTVLRAGLGPRILRTETAGPAAVAVLQALGGDFA